MKRIKAWFHNVVLAEVHKILDIILAEYKKVIEDHIVAVVDRERLKMARDIEQVRLDLRQSAARIHQGTVETLKYDVADHIEAELKAFEAKVQHTLEACIKDEPAHWRADDETKKSDKLHQQPQR